MLETSDGAIALGMSNCECDVCAASSGGKEKKDRQKYDTKAYVDALRTKSPTAPPPFDETAGQIPMVDLAGTENLTVVGESILVIAGVPQSPELLELDHCLGCSAVPLLTPS
ncbi:hypothetical protein ABZX51_006382 [Aspergillus tubingensis]